MTDNTNTAFSDSILTDEVRGELQLYDELAPEDVVKHQASDIQRISHLGTGSYCDVSLVVSRSTKEKLALKRLDRTKIGTPQDMVTAAPDLVIEGHYLAKLDHPNIIKLRGTSPLTFSDSFSESEDGYFLTMDVMEETLTDRLQRWRKDPCCYKTTKGLGFPKAKDLNVNSMYERIRTVTLGIAQAMDYIHKEGIILRDLKPDNVGFHADTGEVCLFDFGFAREVELCSPDEICGTPRYMAPETLKGEGYSFKSDVYSFGVLLHEVASLHRRTRSKKSLIENQADLMSMCNSLSELKLNSLPCAELKSLIKQCLSEDPQMRPSFETIVETLTTILSGETSTKSQMKKGKRSPFSWPSLRKLSTLEDSNSTLATLPDYEYNDLCNSQNSQW